jgi:hypothetical protein
MFGIMNDVVRTTLRADGRTPSPRALDARTHRDDQEAIRRMRADLDRQLDLPDARRQGRRQPRS